MKNEPEKIHPVVPEHVAYWKEVDLNGYMGGRFADFSGGLITFEAESIEKATRILGYQPKFPLETGITKLVEWHSTRKESPKAQ